MEKTFPESLMNPERAAGFVLVSAILVPILMLILFAIRGELPDVFSQIGGAARNPFVRNLSLSGWIIAGLLSLGGLNLLTILLERKGETLYSNVALTAMIFVTVLLVLEATIHLAFGAWANEEFLRIGSEPSLYPVYFEWGSVTLQRVYVPVGYVGLILYGLSILNSDLLPSWTGWLAAGWGGGMLILLLMTRGTLPATLLIPGAVIGIALLAKS